MRRAPERTEARGLSQRRARLEALAAAAAVVLLALVLFHPLVFAGRVLWERDIQLDKIPMQAALARAVRAGSWPLWDESTGFGQPLLANPSAEVLYPPAWLGLLGPADTSYGWLAIAHLVFAGVGVYRLGRRMELGFAGATLGALVWTACGPVLSLVNLWHHFAGACWMPWVLVAAETALCTGTLGSGLVWGACAAGQLLAGSGDMCVMTALAAGVLAARRIEWRAPLGASNRRVAWTCILAACFALDLSTAQWLPTLEALRGSQRWALAPGARTPWSLHPASLLELLFPISFDLLPLQDRVRAALFGSREPFLYSVYLGLPTVALVAAGLLRRWPARAALVVMSGFALLVALGPHTPVYGLLSWLLPPLRVLRYPVKALVPVALGWALLCGAGLEVWMQRDVARGRWWRVVVAPLAALAVLAVGLALWLARAGQELPEHPTVVVAVSGLAILLAGSGVVALVAAALAAARPARPAWTAALLAALCIGDLVHAAGRLNPTVPAEILRQPPALVRLLARERAARVYVYQYEPQPGKGTRHLRDPDPEVNRALKHTPLALRVTGTDPETIVRMQALALPMYLHPALPGVWGLDGAYEVDVRGLDPLPKARLARMLRAVEGTPGELRLLQLGGVSHVVALHTEGFPDLQRVAELPSFFLRPIQVLRVPDPLPRTYVVGSAREADAAAFELLLDPGFDPRHEVIVPEAPPGAAGKGHAGSSRIVDSRPDRVRIDADLEAGGYVVLLDSYDPGWKATIDGVPTPVLRANVAFRAVHAGPGLHRIEYVYRPREVIVGGVLSAAGALGGLAFVVARLAGRVAA